MSNPEANPNFFASFLDDYFAECEEHLTLIQRNLLTLESLENTLKIDRALLDELFRSFHSLKGLSGMVGVKEAEQLAHEMESYLRGLRDEQIQLSSTGMDTLITGTKLLEQVITNYRTQTPAPSIEAVVAQLQTIVPQADLAKLATNPPQPEPVPVPVSAIEPQQWPALQLKPEEAQQLLHAQQQDTSIWRFSFTPDPKLSQLGINVNIIRSHLQEIGKIIHAAPRMTSNGGVAFDFIVIAQAEIPETWKDDGLEWIPYESPSPSVPVASPDIAPVSVPPKNITPDSATSPASISNSTSVAGIPTSSNVVRVELSRLDDLMRMVGELVITRSRLEDYLKNLKGILPETQLRSLKETNQTLEHQLRDLREGVMRVRLVPIGDIFARMQFVIRDLVRASQKQITLELSGQDTEIDKFVVERIMDPLLHLVRNAVSHGIEPASERLQQGKPAVGTIALRAFTAGEMVIIEIEDDGQGIDAESIIQQARDKGLIESDIQSDWSTVLDILCLSGFSTREQVDLASGRGVGMAVVKNTVMELGGFLSLTSTVGTGTRFTIQLPLTLAIADALIIGCGGQIFAIPQTAILEVIQLSFDLITALENHEIFLHRGRVLPLIRLAHLFSLSQPRVVKESLNSQDSLLKVIIAGSPLNSVGIVIDEILGLREIVVRPLTDPLIQVTGISGATELGDRRVVLVLDIADLLQIGRFVNPKIH